MPLVTADRLNAYMGRPSWTDDQFTEAGEICVQKESRLSSRLNAPLTPVPYSETATVLGTGLVATTYPVVSVSAINDTEVPDGAALPNGWMIQEHRLRTTGAVTPSSLTLGSLMPRVGVFTRVEGVGAVRVDYQAGWGPVPALVDEILAKAMAAMINRHDDTIVVRDLDGEAPSPQIEDWTEDEINNTLGIYRNLAVFR
jgi:hypothetical protein